MFSSLFSSYGCLVMNESLLRDKYSNEIMCLNVYKYIYMLCDGCLLAKQFQMWEMGKTELRLKCII